MKTFALVLAFALVAAPTGSGKTLAAFLWELNALITDGLERPLANAVHLLYISPLKALNNDIQRNLERPLAELRERFTGKGDDFPEIRVAVRTGDTPASARARMMRTTPHILITTPESLHILLTSLKGRGMFSALRGVIIDEIIIGPEDLAWYLDGLQEAKVPVHLVRVLP